MEINQLGIYYMFSISHRVHILQKSGPDVDAGGSGCGTVNHPWLLARWTLSKAGHLSPRLPLLKWASCLLGLWLLGLAHKGSTMSVAQLQHLPISYWPFLSRRCCSASSCMGFWPLRQCGNSRGMGWGIFTEACCRRCFRKARQWPLCLAFMRTSLESYWTGPVAVVYQR